MAHPAPSPVVREEEMTTFFLIWYALGWAGTGFYVKDYEHLTFCELVWLIFFGGFTFGFWGIVSLDKCHFHCPVVWRKR